MTTARRKMLPSPIIASMVSLRYSPLLVAMATSSPTSCAPGISTPKRNFPDFCVAASDLSAAFMTEGSSCGLTLRTTQTTLLQRALRQMMRCARLLRAALWISSSSAMPGTKTSGCGLNRRTGSAANRPLDALRPVVEFGEANFDYPFTSLAYTFTDSG